MTIPWQYIYFFWLQNFPVNSLEVFNIIDWKKLEIDNNKWNFSIWCLHRCIWDSLGSFLAWTLPVSPTSPDNSPSKLSWCCRISRSRSAANSGSDKINNTCKTSPHGDTLRESISQPPSSKPWIVAIRCSRSWSCWILTQNLLEIFRHRKTKSLCQ